MLRELAEALEVMTATQPLVLVLEDLHWSDHATVELLAWLARRRRRMSRPHARWPSSTAWAWIAAQGMLVQGVALAAQGHHEAGLAQMRQAMEAIQAAGQEAGRLLAVAVLAEQYGRAGQVEAGLRVLTETLAHLNPQEPRLWEPELHRVRGMLLLQAGGVTLAARCRATGAEAETYFQQARALARRYGAKAFELRAVMGLSQLWQRQGKRQAAYQLLAEVYGGFTEGFDTADLQEAKTLLEALG